MTGRPTRSLVALVVSAVTVWVAWRAVLWWVLLQARQVGPDPLLAEDD